MTSQLASAIYQGTVRHRRFSPKAHEFTYRVFMMYLDTDELDSVLALSPFWGKKPGSIARFKRSDFHADKYHQACNSLEDLPSIAEAIRTTVEAEAGFRPNGAIRMLVNLRYWGYSINPISTYYCFDEANKNVIAIVAEVKNTPWNERHAYVLSGDGFAVKQRCTFKKSLHVSPFNPLDMVYQWYSTTPGLSLAIHLENWREGKLIMDATMTLQKMDINRNNLNRLLIRFPWMTVKVLLAIYWQAVKLYCKALPVFTHPKINSNNSNNEEK